MLVTLFKVTVRFVTDKDFLFGFISVRSNGRVLPGKSRPVRSPEIVNGLEVVLMTSWTLVLARRVAFWEFFPEAVRSAVYEPSMVPVVVVTCRVDADDEPVSGFGLKVPTAPAGKPATLRVTFPVTPVRTI